jgi:lysophospholipase L1-like esterase
VKKWPSAERRALFLLLVLFLLCLPIAYHLIKASANTAFLGDSLTEEWVYPRVNLGIYGNTTAQMFARFPAQIQGHHYRRVVILGGTNDVLLRIDPTVTIHNLQEIGTYTVQAGAQPVLCEIPPIFHSFDPNDKTDYSNQVHTLNQQIIQLAAAHKWKLVDYYDPLLGHPGYSSDGVHMKHRGYIIMEWTYLRETPSF